MGFMKRYIPLASLCFAVFLIMTGMGMAVVALPQKYLATSGTMASSGWLAAVYALAYMCCQYPAGRMADTLGFRPVLAMGCLLTACASVLFNVAHTPLWMYAGRFVQGMGEAPIWASAPALLARMYPDMKGRAMGLYNAAFHLGLMLGPLLVVSLLSSNIVSQDDPFLIFAALCLAAKVIVMVVVRDTPIKTGPVQPAPSKRQHGLRLWPVFVGVIVFGSVYGLLVSCLPVHLCAVAEMSQGQLGVFLFIAYAGIAVSQLGVGVLSDRFGRVLFLMGGMVMIALSLFGFAASSDAPTLATFAVMGLGAGTFAVSSMALVSERSEDHCKGRASGLYFMAWGGGYFAGPLMANACGLVPTAIGLGCLAMMVGCLQDWKAVFRMRAELADRYE